MTTFIAKFLGFIIGFIVLGLFGRSWEGLAVWSGVMVVLHLWLEFDLWRYVQRHCLSYEQEVFIESRFSLGAMVLIAGGVALISDLSLSLNGAMVFCWSMLGSFFVRYDFSVSAPQD